MRLKLDENLGLRHAEMLRRAGHDVDTVHDESLSGAPDEAVLAAAREADRALVTLDLDFADPMRFPPATTAGLVVLRPRSHLARDRSKPCSPNSSPALPRATSAGDCGWWSLAGSASTSPHHPSSRAQENVRELRTN